MDTLLVGFGFRARHGKDTVARMVRDILPAGQAQIMPLAAHLKAFARVLGMKTKDGALLQSLGTDVFRRLDPGVWLRCLAAWVDEERPEVALVPDVRFKNEARFIQERGGLLYRIDRYEPRHHGVGDRSWTEKIPYVDTTRPAGHISETELEGQNVFDRCFGASSGDMGALRAAAVAVAYAIRQRLQAPPDGLALGHALTLREEDFLVGGWEIVMDRMRGRT